MLFSDPVATAPGTDLFQVNRLIFEAKQLRDKVANYLTALTTTMESANQ